MNDWMSFTSYTSTNRIAMHIERQSISLTIHNDLKGIIYVDA